MSILESLFVSVFGMSVVFLVLIGLSLLVRLQSALYLRFTQRKHARELILETHVPVVPAAAPEPAGESEKPVNVDKSSVQQGDHLRRETCPAAGAALQNDSAAVGKFAGSGGKRKYIASVGGKVFEAEVEEVR